MPSKKKNLKKKDSLYTFNQYLDNKDNLGTKSLEAHPWSKKFLSKIFQKSLRCTYPNKNLDNFVYDLDLDNLEKLLSPARIIEPSNITGMIGANVKLDVLADILKALTSNIDVLKNLYDLHISFSAISDKRSSIGSAALGYLKNILEDFKLKMKNWPGNTYEEICKLRAYVLNSLKKAKLKSYDVNSSNYDVDNDITNQTTIKQNPFDLYIANNNKLEGYSWSMKLFFREIFQKAWRSTFTNEDFDGLISSIQLDNLEKLLSPARIIKPSNITGMLVNYSTLNMPILKKTLKVLTLNINILKALYDLEIPFFTISAKLHSTGSKVADLLTEIFKSLVEMIKVHKNNEENLISFDISESTLASVKDKYQKNLPDIINSAFKKINSQEQNNLTINNHQSQTIDGHREDDIETNSDGINTHSDSQKLTANMSNSELTTDEIFNRMLDIDDDDNIKEIVLELNNYIANQSKNQSQTTDKYLENDREDILDQAMKDIDGTTSSSSNSICITSYQIMPSVEEVAQQPMQDDIQNSSDEINTHSDGQELTADMSNFELTTDEIFNRMLDIDDDDNIKKIVLKLNNYIANQSENQSQPIESYQENNIENLQIIRETHTEEVMQSAEKRKSCYDEHEDLCTRKRQCNSPKLNSNHGTEVALNEQDSINVDCATSVTSSYLVGESICILSDTAWYSASILE
ncbi:hypothetical protein OTSSIDO_0239 [Orientia tsutsugamushi str. Sido]|nr:hypothetical protein OTSSIDO_0239 [Orientia tsutsugamushi str. Sido]